MISTIINKLFTKDERRRVKQGKKRKEKKEDEGEE